MAAARHRRARRVAAHREARQRDGAELVCERPLGQHRVVQRAQQLVGRIVAAHRGRAQSVPRERGDGRRVRALAAHVADRDRPLVVTAQEDVVEVSADLVGLTGRAKAGGDLDARESPEDAEAAGSAAAWTRCSCSRRNRRALSTANEARRASSRITRTSSSSNVPLGERRQRDRAQRAPARDHRRDDGRAPRPTLHRVEVRLVRTSMPGACPGRCRRRAGGSRSASPSRSGARCRGRCAPP